MHATRIIITAQNIDWAYNAANATVGFATSVIACGCEAGIEKQLKPKDTPDGRHGLSVLIFSMNIKTLIKQLQNRIGQCVLTSPTSACFAGLYEGAAIPLGKNLRYFGDGYQISKKIGDNRYWRIPVMDGEFLCEETTYAKKAIGGGNFLVLGSNQKTTLQACEKAIKAMKKIANVIMPFPGGVVRSGSKIGSIYKALSASTNEQFCPTIKGQTNTELSNNIGAVMEIVIDGLNAESIQQATKVGIIAACSLGKAKGIYRISAGNYGGNLGSHHFHLQDIVK